MSSLNSFGDEVFDPMIARRKAWLEMIIPALEATLEIIKKRKVFGCHATDIARDHGLITAEQHTELLRVIDVSLGGYAFFHRWLYAHNPRIPRNPRFTSELEHKHRVRWFELEHKYRARWFERMIRDYKKMLAKAP